MVIATTENRPEAAPLSAEEWVEGFAEGWRAPTDPDSFADHFDRLISDEIRLVQPQIPTLVGKREFRELFARPLFSLLSEIRGTVEGWAARDDFVFIDLVIEARVGDRPVRLRTVDRITLRDGLATERRATLDPSPLVLAVAISPRAWPRFARMQVTLLARRLRGARR